MKKLFAFVIVMALMLSVAGCVKVQREDTVSPTAEPQTSADGERFDETIMLEGMEETVGYEHVRSVSAGFEMDYEYGALERYSEPDGETFVSEPCLRLR